MTLQTLQQQGGTREVGHIYLTGWTLSVTATDREEEDNVIPHWNNLNELSSKFFHHIKNTFSNKVQSL